MRRVTKGAAVAAGLAMALAACGSGDGGGDATSGSLTIWADERRAGPIGELATQWGEENGVQVTVTQVNFDQIKDQYAQQAPNGQGPDVFLGANDWAAGYVADGLVAPIDLGDNKDKFSPAAVGAFTVNGQVYGVPVAIENILMFRNTNLAPNTPATINEMAETGLALQGEGKTQFPIGLQVGDKGDAYHAFPFYSAAGGYFFGGPDADGQYDLEDIGVGEEGSLTFAQAWSDLGKQGVLKSTFTGSDLEAAWNAGALPYWITGPWNSELVQNSGVPFAAEPVPGWEALPDTPAIPVVGSQGFYLNANSQNASTAQAFLDAIQNTEFMDAVFDADPRPPAWNDSAEAASADPVIKAILDFGSDGFPNLAVPEMGIIYEELGLAQARILDGADPTASMEEARANIDRRVASGA
jgi:arabinogalactan oligomer/maltooligosaccharide transport system substrate-binding protein